MLGVGHRANVRVVSKKPKSVDSQSGRHPSAEGRRSNLCHEL